MVNFLNYVNSLCLCALALGTTMTQSAEAIPQTVNSEQNPAKTVVPQAATAVSQAVSGQQAVTDQPTVSGRSTVSGQQAVSGQSTTDNSGAEKKSGKATDEPKIEYVRTQRDDKRLAVALQTSIIHFAGSPKYPDTTVDLVGAIHLGETSYYEKLNKRFEDYEVVLFEAVMPERAVALGMRPGVGKRGSIVANQQDWNEAKIGLATIGALQVGMKDALGLDFQLTTVDYSPANFVHADMTQEELESTMAARGESFSQMLAREMAKANTRKSNPMAQQLDFVLSMMTNDRVYRVRRIAAAEISRADEAAPFAGSDGTSTIITERNAKAFQVLQNQLLQGKKKIAVFYGAAHFPDMEERLLKKFGYERKQEEWLTAWKLKSE